jgi:hypothetical protein
MVAMLAFAGMATVVSTAAAQRSEIAAIARTGTITLTGIVLDPSGGALRDVEVSQLENGKAARVVRTGPDGFFEMRQLPKGPVDFAFKRIGFKLRLITLDVEPGADALTIKLEPAATQLDTMMVMATKPVPAKLRGFYARAKVGIGAFLDSAALNKYQTPHLTKILTRVPGVYSHAPASRYNRTGTKEVLVMNGDSGSPCMPTITIDGVRWTGYLDDDVPVDHVAAVEVYNHSVDVPPELVSNPRGCGAIAVWTR